LHPRDLLRHDNDTEVRMTIADNLQLTPLTLTVAAK
jgi:hypothetical protein